MLFRSYFDAMRRAKKEVSETDKELIKDLDHKFFSKLKKSEVGLSLTALVIERDKLMMNNGLGKFSKYPQHLFAAKLKSLGFERYRTAKGNFWNCILD